MRLSALLPALGLALALGGKLLPAAAAEDERAYGPQLEGFEYPWPVSHFLFTSQGEALDMAYLDVKPTTAANGETAVLLHGKNFCAATWQDTKTAHFQYTFQQLAGNTRALLASLGLDRTIVIGHSIGGMLSMRYALTFPANVKLLVLVDPIGLEDWKAKGVPWQSLDGWYQQELKTTAATIREYQRTTYYAGEWNEKYESPVQMLAGLYRGPGHDIVAWNAALTDDMGYIQPVYYELEQIAVPTRMMIGDKDNTALGKNLAPPAIRATLGNYPVLGKAAAARIPGAQLIEFPDLGHAPQIQAPERFHQALFELLGK